MAGSSRCILSLAALVATATAQADLIDWSAGTISDPGTVQEVASFGPNPGNLRMFKYVPDDLPAGAPLVVVLHGCTQAADDYDIEAGWAKYAEVWDFALLMPQQKPENNAQLCFNWYVPAHTTRGLGEAASIRQMIEQMKRDHGVDPARVFVTGVSAGGAMTSVMLGNYPEVFAGGNVIAGIPFGCAYSLTEALLCMDPGQDLDPAVWGDKVRNATTHNGPWPRVTAWSGTEDLRVNYMNVRQIMKQWTDVHGIDQVADYQEIQRHGPGELSPENLDPDDHLMLREVYESTRGRGLVETVLITNMDHGMAVAPGAAEDECGTERKNFLPVGVCTAYEVGKFWGLDAWRTRKR